MRHWLRKTEHWPVVQWLLDIYRRFFPMADEPARVHYHELLKLERQIMSQRGFFGNESDHPQVMQLDRQRRLIVRKISRLPERIIHEEQCKDAEIDFVWALENFIVARAARLWEMHADIWAAIDRDVTLLPAFQRMDALGYSEAQLKTMVADTVRDMPHYTRKPGITKPAVRTLKTYRAHLKLNVERHAKQHGLSPDEMVREVDRWFMKESAFFQAHYNEIMRSEGDRDAKPEYIKERIRLNIMSHVAVLAVLHISRDEIHALIREGAAHGLQ
ncbi:MAG: hypothetical protein AAFR56_02605 [Chloroflexota bacterium]